MKVTTQMLEAEVYEAISSDGNKIKIDMRNKEIKESQNPVELLLSSLSACAAVDIVSILNKRRRSIDSFIIETEGTRREDPPRYFTTIHCKYIITSNDVTKEELHKAAKLSLEKYCSIAASLKAEISFSIEVLANM